MCPDRPPTRPTIMVRPLRISQRMFYNIDIFCQVSCVSAGASLLFWGFRLAFFPRILEPTEFPPEVHIFAQLPAMDQVFPEFLRDASWSWRTLFLRAILGRTTQLNILFQ